MKREKINSILGIAFILILFAFCSYLVQSNIELVQSYLYAGFLGMMVFVILVILSIVIAPVSVVPLFPLASALWGWQTAGLLGTIGWTIGAVIAFALARSYGVGLVRKLLPIKRIYQFEKKIPEKNLFLTLVFLRMVTPMDGVSYIFGLFTNMTLRSYTLATLIGLVPFTFVVSYMGSMPFYFVILFLSIALALLALGLLVAYYKKNKKHAVKAG
jgi:uncharacterized membrane protein YdjX (TVP38/TMEM64 family)